jgi:hypothetical protein
MNPWLIGGAALLALAAAASASATSAVQQAMVFRDYAWITLLPSSPTGGGAGITTSWQGQTHGPVSNVAAQLPPPPGQSAASGHWIEYRGGLTRAVSRGVPQGPWLPVWPNVPAGHSIYQWVPTPGHLQQINGFWTVTGGWQLAAPVHAPAGQVLSQMPHIVFAGSLPPPPGQTVHSGAWHMVQPGYNVWLTLQNVTSYGPGRGPTLLTQPFADPGLAAALAQPSGMAPPIPSPVPIATTPVPATPVPGPVIPGGNLQVTAPPPGG